MYSKSVAFFAIAINLICITSAQHSYESAEAVYDVPYTLLQQYDAQPIRVRRQIYGGITPGNPGKTVTLGAQGNIYNNNGHSVDGHAQVSRTFQPAEPTSIGGGLDYKGPRAGASVNVDHVHRFGTNVGAQGNMNVWRSNNGRSTLDANAGYNQHFGGPFGNSRPNYNVGANFIHRF